MTPMISKETSLAMNIESTVPEMITENVTTEQTTQSSAIDSFETITESFTIEETITDVTNQIDYLLINNSLIHHWPFDGDVNDIVGGANLTDGYNFNFTFDRFMNATSSVRLNDGYLLAPSDIDYFPKGKFSILAWIRIHEYKCWSRLIDFGDGPANNTIYIVLSYETIGTQRFALWTEPEFFNSVDSIQNMTLGEWHHIAATYENQLMTMYIDGFLIGERLVNRDMNVKKRTNNYIGKSNWFADEYANVDIDDMKIFDRALNQNEVNFEMNFIK